MFSFGRMIHSYLSLNCKLKHETKFLIGIIDTIISRADAMFDFCDMKKKHGEKLSEFKIKKKVLCCGHAFFRIIFLFTNA